MFNLAAIFVRDWLLFIGKKELVILEILVQIEFVLEGDDVPRFLLVELAIPGDVEHIVGVCIGIVGM